jgi:UDP-GlcNAc:undecaprenyl-phosphate GlcNAc-1-phosphate transferase
MALFFIGISFLFAYSLTPVTERLARSFGALDLPGERKIHDRIVPRLGGVAIFTGFVGSATIYFLFVNPASWRVLLEGGVLGLAGAVLLIFALGVYDDFRGTNAWVKFTVQILAALLVVWNGYVISGITHPAGGRIDLGFLAVPVTVLWLVGVSNAFNLIDGVDGVAGGIGAIVAGTMSMVGFATGNLDSAFLAAGLCGALVGFLRYNFYPARIFMGDSGSLFVGFTLAALAIKASQVSATTVSFLTPLVAFGLPIMDTSFSFFRRMVAGKSPFQADDEHIHHKILRETLSHRHTAVILYIFCFLLNAAALFLMFRNRWLLPLWVVLGTFLLAGFPCVRRMLRLTGNGNGSRAPSNGWGVSIRPGDLYTNGPGRMSRKRMFLSPSTESFPMERRSRRRFHR